MTVVPPHRFTGIDNFRDFGGFRGRDGAIPLGALFRSGHLANAGEHDRAILQGLALNTIVDLRRPAERVQQPSLLPAAFAGSIITEESGDRGEAPHLEFLKQGDHSDAAVEAFLLDYYRAAPLQPRHLILFSGAFAAIATGKILIHCTAGKDRTGILVALVQLALGAHRDDVMTEFLETNRIMLTVENRSRTAAGLRRLFSVEPSSMMIDAMLGVNAHHLDAALESAGHEAGSLQAYLRQLGVNTKWQADIRWLHS